jgi:hypothetical protein
VTFATTLGVSAESSVDAEVVFRVLTTFGRIERDFRRDYFDGPDGLRCFRLFVGRGVLLAFWAIAAFLVARDLWLP